jgi:hypothetical protein
MNNKKLASSCVESFWYIGKQTRRGDSGFQALQPMPMLGTSDLQSLNVWRRRNFKSVPKLKLRDPDKLIK